MENMYLTEQAMDRMHAAERQTAAIIKQKFKRGQLLAIEAVDEIFKKELNEGKVEVLTVEEFRRKAKKEPTAFTRLNLTFNPDLLSTPVRLIHDFTTAVGSTTLSLEVLILDNALDSIVEASLSFRLFELIQCWDIAKCYTQITWVVQFVLCSLNLWFRDIETCKDPLILERAAMTFGFPASPGVLEIAIFKYIWRRSTNQDLKTILGTSRFADNIVNY